MLSIFFRKPSRRTFVSLRHYEQRFRHVKFSTGVRRDCRIKSRSIKNCRGNFSRKSNTFLDIRYRKKPKDVSSATTLEIRVSFARWVRPESQRGRFADGVHCVPGIDINGTTIGGDCIAERHTDPYGR